MTVVYQSRLLRFWRVQIHRWQHHWQIQHRRWQTSLKWTVQAWVYPLYRLIQVNQWLPGSIKHGIKAQWQALQAQAQPPTPPACDTPIVNLLQSLEVPGLTQNTAAPDTQLSLVLHPPQPEAQSFVHQTWAQLNSFGISHWQRLQAFLRPSPPPQLPAIPNPLALAPTHPAAELSDPPRQKNRPPIQAWWQWFGTVSRNRPATPSTQSSPPETLALTTLTAPLELIPTEKTGTFTAPTPNLAWEWLKTATHQLSQTTLSLWKTRAHITQPLQALIQRVQTGFVSDSAEIQLSQSLNLAPFNQYPTSGLEPQTIEIQGIACQLANQHLVLVGANNQIFDILTGPQQKQLAERILWELAGYYYQLRQWHHLTGQSLARWGLTSTPDVLLNSSPEKPRPSSLQPLQLAAGLGIAIRDLWSHSQAWLFSWPSPASVTKVPNRTATLQPLAQFSDTATPLPLNKPSPNYLSSTDPHTLDIGSTFLGYEPQGLEIIWLWLDRLFLWLERAWAWFWTLGLKLVNLN